MASLDWSPLSGGLTDSNVKRGATAGATAPNGGGSYVFGMHSIANVAGAVGMHCVLTDFNPTAKGGRITGAIRRGVVGGASGFAPFLFMMAAGDNVSDAAYILGLSDEAASHVELRKGAISQGLPDAAVDPDAVPNILMRSTDTWQQDVWQHLRLDVIAQGNGDVVLQVYRSDLLTRPVHSPIWSLVPGMEGPFHPSVIGFVDDALGINTGSAPLTGGRVGFGARFETANRACFVDHVSIERQL